MTWGFTVDKSSPCIPFTRLPELQLCSFHKSIHDPKFEQIQSAAQANLSATLRLLLHYSLLPTMVFPSITSHNYLQDHFSQCLSMFISVTKCPRDLINIISLIPVHGANFDVNWATSWENLPLRFAPRSDANRPAQLHRLARIMPLKI